LLTYKTALSEIVAAGTNFWYKLGLDVSENMLFLTENWGFFAGLA